MIDKKMGRHCSFKNAYVAIHMKYEKEKVAERSCEESGCSNLKCNLSKSFMGDRAMGNDFLDHPKR